MDVMHVFDRRSVRQHRDRAAASLETYDFLLREAGERLLDRLDDIRRSFPVVLDLGCHDGLLASLLAGRGGIETLVQSDLSPAMVARTQGLRLVADEEALPFRPENFDAVMSLLSLHWVNDLPGTLTQIRQSLKPDGMFLGAMLGGETLRELRTALVEAEIAVEGGLSPRVSPFTDVRDAGGLLQRAGFALPVVDSETLCVRYSSALQLMRDLRGMGETNAVLERRRTLTRRATMLEAAKRYHAMFADSPTVPATFQIIFLIGWCPDASQPQALKPGSARVHLADALRASEISDDTGTDRKG